MTAPTAGALLLSVITENTVYWLLMMVAGYITFMRVGAWRYAIVSALFVLVGAAIFGQSDPLTAFFALFFGGVGFLIGSFFAVLRKNHHLEREGR